MGTLSKITCFLTLFIICCTKNKTVFHEKKDVIFFDKNYNNLTKLKKENYLDSLGDLLIKTRENDTLTRNLHLELATEYYYINNINKSLSHSEKALKLSKEVNDIIREPKALFYIGDCYRNTRKDSAYFYYLHAEKLYIKIQDYDNTARMLFNKAHILFYDGNYIECEVEISNAIRYLTKSKNYQLIYSCNNLMGNCLEKLANYDEALRYHKIAMECLDTMRINNIDKDEINNYNVTSIINISNLYDLKGEYSKSITALQGILTEELKNRWPRLYANVLSNLAYSKMKNGDYNNVQSMFFEALNIVESSGIESDVLYKKIYLGEFFLTQKDTIKSIEILKEANELAVKIKSSNEVLTSLKLLSTVDIKNSLFYANTYINVSDSINLVQKNAHHKYARIEYETSLVTDENKVLSKNNLYLLTICVGLLFLFIIISLFRHIKYKNKELIFLKRQHLANEEIYQLLSQEHEKMNIVKENEKAKIAKELHDGIMNKIYGVRMNLGFMNTKIDDKIIKKRREYIDELQNIENEIRTISHDLSYTTFFDGNDFNYLLRSLIENHQNIIETHFKLESDPQIEWLSIPNIYKINMYRIIQEAILNVSKYANAKNCTIKIILHNFLELNIIDDGDGFDVNHKKNGIGLINLNERVKSLKGHFKIESVKGKGTKINVMFSLHILMMDQKYS
ncbi:tetratricopeptide repeat-containing sensor histidine kinase [Flavobacterium xinjiangense]|uniref:histidine kinase n=1 Tax=Flavobacterium xinjiangense TaxID=178356 RepID=A0A1M7N5U7_9FLAO|nr:tetratricopeptide repeat-containing sensor histidine kinase [Flavobacterium xinjiangense]SHM98395.1 Signal transduction histidine kinase [Flavobacterium xinjiangense]